MKSKSTILIVTIIISFGILNTTSITVAHANPNLYSRLGTGLTLPPSSSTSLPSSEVNISIVSVLNNSTSVRYDINITGSFKIHSDTNQNITLMFISPGSWIPWSDSEHAEPWTNITVIQVRTTVDSIETSYDIRMWNELLTPPELNEPEWEGWDGIRISKFIVFDAMLYESLNTTVGIELNFGIVSTAQIFDFYYFVDSARSWVGNTHERIQISVEDRISFTEYDFLPDLNLEVVLDDPLIVGNWDFITNQFDEDYVDFWGVHPFDISSSQLPPPTLLDSVLLLAIPISVVTVLIIAGWALMREFR